MGSRVELNERGIAAYRKKILTQTAFQLEAYVKENITAGGIPFKPLKSGSTRKPLIKTGAMRRGVQAKQEGNTASVEIQQPYYQYHEWGTRTIPKRAFIWPAIEKLRAKLEAEGVKVTILPGQKG